MKRLILLVALVMAMAVLAPAAFADEAEEIEGSDTEMEEKNPSVAQLWKAQMIADYFTEAFESEGGDPVTREDVSALRAGGEDGHKIGWGVLYKLMLYAGPDGFDPEDFENGWAIGELRKIYLETHDRADLHKNNLGQLQKSYKDKPEKPAKIMPPQSNKDKHKG